MAGTLVASGRRWRITLYDADLHDLTVQWVQQWFGVGGSSGRFAPGQRTVGGIATYPMDCNDINNASCESDVRRCGFLYSEPYLPQCGTVQLPTVVDPSTDGRRSRDWQHPNSLPWATRGTACAIEGGQAGRTTCACPPDRVPVDGSTLYFRTPGYRFPLFTRSIACVAEYISGEVQGLLNEVNEILTLARATYPEGGLGPRVLEPPVRGLRAIDRIVELETAIQTLVVGGESDIRLFRIPG